MSILIKFLFFFNIFNIFSTDTCKLILFSFIKNSKKEVSCSFKIQPKKYTFEEFKNELDKKFNENKNDKECKDFIDKSKKNNYSELLKDYKLLCFNDDYNIDNFAEIDLTDKKEFYLEYSYEIDKKYDFKFYDIEIKEDFKKKLAEKLKIKEEEISKEFEDEVKQLNNFLNKKKLFIPNKDIKLVFDSLNFKIMNFNDFGVTFKLYCNYNNNDNDFTILDDVKNGFSFHCDDFKPVKATIIRIDYETKKQYGQKIEKEIYIKYLDLYDCVNECLEYIFPNSDPLQRYLKKINDYEISFDIQDQYKDLKKLKNILRTENITIEIYSRLKTHEEKEKEKKEYEKKMKEKSKELDDITKKKKEEQQKNKCCCC